MISIVNTLKSSINVSFSIISDSSNDYDIIRKIADENKCIKFSCYKCSPSKYYYEIIFRTKNEKYENFEKQIKGSKEYTDSLK